MLQVTQATQGTNDDGGDIQSLISADKISKSTIFEPVAYEQVNYIGDDDDDGQVNSLRFSDLLASANYLWTSSNAIETFSHTSQCK